MLNDFRYAFRTLRQNPGFALVATLSPALGIGMSYSVSRRMREIGIRMAIGADRVKVVGMVLKHGLLLAGIGVAIGILLCVLFSRALTMGMGLPFFNLTALALVSAALLTAAAPGACTPTRRPSLVDPMRMPR